MAGDVRYLRHPDSDESRPLPGSHGGASCRWSGRLAQCLQRRQWPRLEDRSGDRRRDRREPQRGTGGRHHSPEHAQREDAGHRPIDGWRHRVLAGHPRRGADRSHLQRGNYPLPQRRTRPADLHQCRQREAGKSDGETECGQRRHMDTRPRPSPRTGRLLHRGSASRRLDCGALRMRRIRAPTSGSPSPALPSSGPRARHRIQSPDGPGLHPPAILRCPLRFPGVRAKHAASELLFGADPGARDHGIGFFGNRLEEGRFRPVRRRRTADHHAFLAGRRSRVRGDAAGHQRQHEEQDGQSIRGCDGVLQIGQPGRRVLPGRVQRAGQAENTLHQGLERNCRAKSSAPGPSD